jgi:hypothetical protein
LGGIVHGLLSKQAKGRTSRQEVVVPAKTLKTGKETTVYRAAAAVSETLLQEVTALFKRLLKIRYESPQELDQASEWKELEKLFCESCDAYTSIAINNRGSLRGDLFTWVEEKIKADEDAITVEHFWFHPDGRLALAKGYEGGLVEHDDTWRAHSHLDERSYNSAFWVFEKNIARAKSTALRNAAIRIASGSARDAKGWEVPTPASELRIQQGQPVSESETARAGGLAQQAQSEQRARASESDALLLKYRSEVKRAILIQLAQNPRATDLEICRGLDADGSLELPQRWRGNSTDRGFFDAYSDASRRHNVEAAISKVRRDLREQGLLPKR